MKAQNIKVMEYLKKNGSMTTWEAISKLNILRASARVYDLRCAGHEIMTFWQGEGRNKIAKYVLMKEAT